MQFKSEKYSIGSSLIEFPSELLQELPNNNMDSSQSIERLLFLPECENRKVEGGLRCKRNFNKREKYKTSRYKEKGNANNCLDIGELNDFGDDNDTPRITIITVVFNSENLIEKTINSVLDQTYGNIEYIIIDGGSNDKTVDIVKMYDNFIDYWVSESDLGIYDAMNKGLKLSTGDWINFMNAGDFFSTRDVVKRIFNKELPISTNFIFGSANLIDFDLFKHLRPKKFSKLNLAFWGTRVVCHQSIFIKRSFAPVYSSKIKLKGELSWYFEIVNKKPIIHVVNFPVVNYRLGGLGDLNYLLNIRESVMVSFNQNIFIGFISLPVNLYKFMIKFFHD